MTTFLRMLIAHILADFSLQSDKSVNCKKGNLWKSPSLYKHVFIYALLVSTVSFAWQVSWKTFFGVFAILFFSHLLIDGVKVRFEDKLPYFVVDQFIHISILIAIAAHLSPEGFKPFYEPLIAASSSSKALVITLGFLVVLWPAGVLISYLIGPFKNGIKQSDDTKGLEKAGLWIGFLERFLTYGFVIAGYPQAISLLVAGKSVFRFGEIKDGKRAEVEYILIGSLISFTLAMAVGQIVKLLISNTP